jgi:ISXO2-like transposase domain
MKRGIHGVYHQVGPKHLRRYVDEFTFRLKDGNVKVHTMNRLEHFIASGIRLTYVRLIG